MKISFNPIINFFILNKKNFNIQFTRFVIFNVLILSFCFSANAKTFKSIQGFTFSIDGYELISPISSDSAVEFIKKNPSFNSDKFIQFYENYKKSGLNIKLEFLLKSGDDLGINYMMITATDKVDKIFRNKNKSEININDYCNAATRQANKTYGINQTIYACMWIPHPKNVKFSFLREVSGIRIGRTIQIQFVKDNRQYLITALSTSDQLKKMRQDITLLAESIKF